MSWYTLLQPFEDVNKRVSRLATNIPLIRENLSPLSFVDMPERAYVDEILGVYELNRLERLRDVFIWVYEHLAAIKQYAGQNVKKDDQARFVEVVETELMSLHEGNIARYRLRPSEFDAWNKIWK